LPFVSIIMDDYNRLIAELREKIRTLDVEYYAHGRSLVSDAEYDGLFAELRNLEQRFPQFVSSDSPTQRVASDLTAGFAKVTHAVPMMSIDNTYSETEVREWIDKVRTLLNGEMPVFVGELKVDGVASALIYQKSKLVAGVTRGDGVTGDDVTANVRTLRSVPLSIASEYTLEVRGEIYMTFGNFRSLNAALIENGQKPMQNPRNTTSGTLKLLDPGEVARRGLSFASYFLLSPRHTRSHLENLALLHGLGFPTVVHSEMLKTADEVLAFIKEWETKRHTLDFPVDGVVIKVDGIGYQEKLGATARSPRWVIAFKYKPETASTQVLAIEPNVGRTGVVTPVAKLEPVPLAGTTVRNATLHNYDEIKRLDVRVSDTVAVEKGGEIIPKITGVLTDRRLADAQPCDPPRQCPSCGARLVRLEGEVAIRCVNNSCPAQLFASITHFVSRAAMNIEGIGPSLIAKLLEAGFIHTVADLFTLDKERLALLEGLGEKSAQNILNALNASKKSPLDRLIHGIGIRMVGAQTAKILAREVADIAELYTMPADRLCTMKNVGEQVAQSVRSFFDREENRNLIERLRSLGVNCEGLEKPAGTGALDGKTFVLTGALARFTREQAAALIEERGGQVSASVSRKTSFVVSGEEAGSKLVKAQTLGVPILSEEDFVKLLGIA